MEKFNKAIEKYVLLAFFVFLSFEGSAQDNKLYGIADDNKFNGQGIGGVYYNKTIKKFPIQHVDFAIKTEKDLVEAIKLARSGQIIYFPSDVKLNMTGYSNLNLKDGVNLVGDKDNGNGPLIYVEKGQSEPLFIITGNNVSIKGIRFYGPDAYEKTAKPEQFSKEKEALFVARSKKTGTSLDDYRKMYAAKPMSCFFAQNKNSKIVFEVNNCEFKGWSHSGILVGKNAKGYICFNYIHGNKHYGLGYGICFTYGEGIIQGNYFNDNRHSIAGTGVKGSGYEASYNIVGPLGVAQAFDMHGGKDRGDGTNIAGSYISIHNNEFQIENNAIVIRGIPQDSAKIYRNVFKTTLKDPEAHFVQQWYSKGKILVFDNLFISDNKRDIKARSNVMPRKLIKSK